MADHNRKRVEHGRSEKSIREDSIGNQQQTTQTGAQNDGGTRTREDDEYTEDLKQSGDRHSSNRKEE